MGAISEGNWSGREAGSDGTFYCPRRDDMASWLSGGRGSPIFVAGRVGTDEWRTRGSNDEPGCSYCGSIMPERLFQILDGGGEIGPTDKGYKFYVHEKGTGECSYCKGTGKDAVLVGREGEEARAVARDCSICGGTGKGANGPEWKFYLQHFSQDDRTRFLDLHNDGRIAYGYPGYLYAKPYFARKAS